MTVRVFVAPTSPPLVTVLLTWGLVDLCFPSHIRGWLCLCWCQLYTLDTLVCWVGSPTTARKRGKDFLLRTWISASIIIMGKNRQKKETRVGLTNLMQTRPTDPAMMQKTCVDRGVAQGRIWVSWACQENKYCKSAFLHIHIRYPSFNSDSGY